jgi:hypothetical protein
MGGRRNELIGGIPQVGTDSVHGFGYIFGSVARHVLLDRIAEQLAPRFLRTPREPLRSIKDIVWNGHRRLHTISITLPVWQKVAFATAEVGETDQIVTVGVEATPIYDTTTGIITAVEKCNVDAICQ